MTGWENLVAYDNISFNYDCNHGNFTEANLKPLKKILNKYMNNLYNGYIKKHGVNMAPSLSVCRSSMTETTIDYNVSCYPSPSPLKFPQDLFDSLPDEIKMDGLGSSGETVFTKKSFHTV